MSFNTYDWRGVEWYDEFEEQCKHTWPYSETTQIVIKSRNLNKGEKKMKATHKHILDTIKDALESADSKAKSDNEKLFDAELEHGGQNLMKLFASLDTKDQLLLLHFADKWFKNEPAKS